MSVLHTGALPMLC